MTDATPQTPQPGMDSGPGKKLRVAAVGDLHVGEAARHPFQELFARVGEDADVLCLCGDLVNFGKTSEVEILLEDIKACTIPIVGVMGNPGQGNYAASKAGLIGMNKALAHEVASRNITVNSIAPGFIASAMTDELNDKQRDAILSTIPAHRLGTAQEVAACAVFLSSDAAAYVTGHTLNVNGGMAMV